MERREFVGRLGVGSAVALVSGGVGALTAAHGAAGAGPEAESTMQSAHDHRPVRDPFAAATVTFGAWRTDVPIDRYPNASPAANNAHLAIPYLATIKASGAVSFLIAGLHHVVVYGPGTRPEHVLASLTRPTTGTPAGVLLIDDPANRIYAGPDPSLLPRDRVEVVQFPVTPGRYLVICGVQSHFVNDQMFGWVRVRPSDDDDN